MDKYGLKRQPLHYYSNNKKNKVADMSQVLSMWR